MSSFKKSKSNSYQCVYCKKTYIPARERNNGFQCPQCHLWQPNTPLQIVRHLSRFSYKQFSKIYAINLKRDVSRWKKFLQRLTPQFCILENRLVNRFIGVDGSNKNSLNEYIDFYCKSDKVNKFAQETPGSIGCYLSHMTLWQHILDTHPNDKYVLIMEDDAFFLPYAVQNIDIALSQADKIKWDILYIGHNTLRGNRIHPLFLKPRKAKPGEQVKGINTGFFGYAVRVSSLQKMIRVIKEFDSQYVDLAVRERFGEDNNSISVLFLYEPLIRHNTIYTSSRREMDGTI